MNKNDSDFIQQKLAKAKDILGEVQVHIENRFWGTAVNRMNYACYHAVGALLLSKGISAKSHSGIIQAFGLHFVKEVIVSPEHGKLIAKLF